MRRLDPFEKFVVGLCVLTVIYFTGHIFAAWFNFN